MIYELDGKRYDVPDDTTLDELEQMVGGGAPAATAAPAAAAPAPAAPVKRTASQEMLRQLGLTARAGVTGFTGTTAMLADLPIALANLAGAKLPLPSEAQQQLMTRVGLPEPETGIEHAAQIGASVLAGSRDPLVRAISPARQTIPLTPREQVMDQSMQAGYKMTPSQAGRPKGPLYGIERLSGEQSLREGLREQHQEVTAKLSRRALGWPDTAPLTPETLGSLRNAIADETYRPLDQLGQITTGRVYRERLANILREQGNTLDPQVNAKVERLVQSNARRIFDAKQLRQGIAALRNDAADYFAKRDPDAKRLAQAHLGIADALEEAIDMNLAATGQRDVLANFRKGREALAKTFEVERALKSSDSVDALRLAARLKKGAPLTDELRTIADFGREFPYLAASPIGTVPQPLGIARSPRQEFFRALPRAILTSSPVQARLRPKPKQITPSAARFLPATYNSLFGEPDEQQ